MTYKPLANGRYIVPKGLLDSVERVAHHQGMPAKEWITNTLQLRIGAYKNLPKLPAPPPPPPPPPPVDINPLMSDAQREWSKGHFYCEKRGTDHLGQKYTDKMWLDAVVDAMEREELTGERLIKGPDGKMASVRIHEGTMERGGYSPLLPSEQRMTDDYNAWVNGGYQGPEPPRPFSNMEYYGFKKSKS